MFAKLKKKIENEGGVVPSPTDSTGKLAGSMTSLPRAGSVQHLGISPPGSVAGDSVCLQDDSFSRDEIVSLLQKKSEQCKKLEGNISDLAALVKDKSKTVERLEAALKQTEENANKQLQEQKEEFERHRDQLLEGHQNEKFRLDKLQNTEEALRTCQSELKAKTAQYHTAESQVERLTSEAEELKLKVSTLESEILKLREENKERSELVITLSKCRATFEKKLGDMNRDIEEKQSQISQLEAQLFNLDLEYKNAISALDTQEKKTIKQLQEKDSLIDTLQERVKTLEQRISDFSLTEDDRLKALQLDRDLMEQKLSETRLQLAEARTILSDRVSRFDDQVKNLKNRLEETEKRALENLEQATSKEANYKKQIEDLETELRKQKLQASENEKHLKATVDSIDMQMKAVEASCKMEKQHADSKIVHLEERTALLSEQEVKLESQVSDLKETLKKLQEVLMEKNKEIESLRQLVQEREIIGSDQTSSIEKLHLEISQAKLELGTMKDARDKLEKHLQLLEEEKVQLLASTTDMQKEIETLKSINSASKLELDRVSDLNFQTEATLKQKVESLEHMVKQSEISKTESGLHTEKIDEMSQTISSLQSQLADKNRIVKKQEQTLKDLRVTLQRELKVQSLPNDEGQDTTNSSTNSSVVSSKPGSHTQPSPRPTESQLHKQYLNEQNHKHFIMTNSNVPSPNPAAVLSLQSSPSNMVTLTASSSSVSHNATDALTIRTNTVKRELDKDINFLYLKHVILKFMLSRESEAMQLIKAVSMLLNFTHQEQQLIKDTLEWKMSWFGHRPSVGEGQTSKVIPPAL